MKTVFTHFLVLSGSFLLSFMMMGLVWTGYLWVTIIPIILYAPISWGLYKVGHVPFMSVLLGFFPSMPLYSFLVQFRDSKGSHLIPCLIVGGCFLSLIIGVVIAIYQKKRKSIHPTT